MLWKGLWKCGYGYYWFGSYMPMGEVEVGGSPTPRSPDPWACMVWVQTVKKNLDNLK